MLFTLIGAVTLIWPTPVGPKTAPSPIPLFQRPVDQFASVRFQLKLADPLVQVTSAARSGTALATRSPSATEREARKLFVRREILWSCETDWYRRVVFFISLPDFGSGRFPQIDQPASGIWHALRLAVMHCAAPRSSGMDRAARRCASPLVRSRRKSAPRMKASSS